jgi:hypothetical protein
MNNISYLVVILIMIASFLCNVQSEEVMFTKVDLTVSSTEEIQLCGRNEYENITIGTGGEIKIKSTNDPEKQGIMELVTDLLIIEENGKINVSETNGNYSFCLNATGIGDDHGYGGHGGGYGGKGGAHLENEQCSTYGNSDQPNIDRGSRGGYDPGGLLIQARAGGSITIKGNNVNINGIIECNGENGPNSESMYCTPEDSYSCQFGGGGGSGGGILILAKNLTIGSNAIITVNGGDGGRGQIGSCRYPGYAGGGGRIKIFYEQGTISELAVIEAKAGVRGRETCSEGGAEDGTVHIQQVRSIAQLLNPGDINGDGTTDSQDLFLLMQSWHEVVESATE